MVKIVDDDYGDGEFSQAPAAKRPRKAAVEHGQDRGWCAVQVRLRNENDGNRVEIALVL